MPEERIVLIECYDGPGWSSYLLRVNNRCYEMGKADCNSPQRVNMYAGTWDEWEGQVRKHGFKLDAVPEKVLWGWLQRKRVLETI